MMMVVMAMFSMEVSIKMNEDSVLFGIEKAIRARLKALGYPGVETGVRVSLASKKPGPDVLVIGIGKVNIVMEANDPETTLLSIVEGACLQFIVQVEQPDDEIILYEQEFRDAFEARLRLMEICLPGEVKVTNFRDWLEVKISGIEYDFTETSYSVVLDSQARNQEEAGEQAADFLAVYFNSNG